LKNSLANLHFSLEWRKRKQALVKDLSTVGFDKVDGSEIEIVELLNG
jgi:hypothetical protein